MTYSPSKGRSKGDTAGQDRRRKLRRYGVSEDWYQETLSTQGGVCAICKQPETSTKVAGGTYRLAIDHSHTTGRVRGLLCFKCNTLIGRAGDNAELALSVYKYLALYQ
jgi:hypothetical protein